jgi:hypothetical protein
MVYALSFSLTNNLTPLSVAANIALPFLWAHFQHNTPSLATKPPQHPAYTAVTTITSTLSFYALQRAFFYYTSSWNKPSQAALICQNQNPEIQSLCQASCETLSKTYRQTAKLYHPDRGGNAEIMTQINAFYENQNTKC